MRTAITKAQIVGFYGLAQNPFFVAAGMIGHAAGDAGKFRISARSSRPSDHASGVRHASVTSHQGPGEPESASGRGDIETATGGDNAGSGGAPRSGAGHATLA